MLRFSVPNAVGVVPLHFAQRLLGFIEGRTSLCRSVSFAAGVMLPGATTGLQDVLPIFALALGLFGVLSMEFTPPSGQEARVAGGMALLVAAVCPAVVIALGRGLGLAPDLVLAAGVIAAAPIATSAGVQGRGLGVATRPPVWAALAGSVVAAAVLPVVVLLCGRPGVGDPLVLARMAALFGIAPALTALLLRRLAPETVGRCQRPLRGAVTLALLPAAFIAGGRLGVGFLTAPAEAAVAVATAVATLLLCGGIGAAFGRLLFGRMAGTAFALVS